MNIQIKKVLYEQSPEFIDYKEKQEPIKKSLAVSLFSILFFVCNTVFLIVITPKESATLVSSVATFLTVTSLLFFFYYAHYAGSSIAMLRNNKKDFEKKMKNKFLVIQ